MAAAPEGHAYLHDDSETVASVWIRPKDALARAERGELEIIFPTMRNLEQLGRFPTAGELLEAVTASEPRVVADAGARHPAAGRSRLRGGGLMPDMTPGVPSALSPLVRRIVAPNPGPMTGPGTNTYLVGIDEVAVIDPGPDTKKHIDAIVGASMRERVRWVLLTHTHPDHAPGTERLVKATGAEVVAFSKRDRRS